jgi:hypothetical protein
VALGGMALVAMITLVHVMFAVLFNSICDLTGGLPVTIQASPPPLPPSPPPGVEAPSAAAPPPPAGSGVPVP